MGRSRNRRIAFLGGKPLSARCLQLLFECRQESEVEIVAVVGRPRGQRGWWSAPGVPELTDTALALGLNVVPEESALERYDPDLILSVLHFRILPPRILALPRNGALNLHLAPLPNYRGCNSCTHAILNGERRFGATLHHMDERVDHGDVIKVTWFDIPADATARRLMALAEEAAFELFRECLPQILDGDLDHTPQESIARREGIVPRYYSRASLSTPGIKEVDRTWPEDKILRHVRAFDFPPFEPAYAVLGGQKVHLRTSEG